MNRACATALAALVLCSVAPAAAQDQLVTTFVPDAQRRWDAAWFVGWRGVDKSEVAPEWDEWYDVAAFSASAGHYLTPHVKIDLDVSTTTTGRVYGQQVRDSRPVSVLPAPVGTDSAVRPLPRASPTSFSRTDGFIPSLARASRAFVRRSGSMRSSCRQAARGRRRRLERIESGTRRGPSSPAA